MKVKEAAGEDMDRVLEIAVVLSLILGTAGTLLGQYYW